MSSATQRIHQNTSLFTTLHRLVDALSLLVALGLVCRLAPSAEGLPKMLSRRRPP